MKNRKIRLIIWFLNKFKYVQELHIKMGKYELMKRQAHEVITWCGYEFPETACTAKWLLNCYDHPPVSGAWGSISCFREALREGKCNRKYSIIPPMIGMIRIKLDDCPLHGNLAEDGKCDVCEERGIWSEE